MAAKSRRLAFERRRAFEVTDKSSPPGSDGSLTPVKSGRTPPDLPAFDQAKKCSKNDPRNDLRNGLGSLAAGPQADMCGPGGGSGHDNDITVNDITVSDIPRRWCGPSRSFHLFG
jgi:hypothetical protein